ncbi:had-like protein [Nannochloropsis gaditana]|uniref:Had-like protein n=1 Tax=Nannochloropsis gaditana TaxID=72520 RepID=W7U286_9STRA|nr:had-like protein [Nannochloropsis gaditana]
MTRHIQKQWRARCRQKCKPRDRSEANGCMMVKRHRRQNDEPLVRLGPSLSTVKSHAAVIVVDDSSDEECEGGSREASCSKRLPKTTPIETHATNRSEMLRLPPSTASFPKGCPPFISPTSDSAHQRLRVLLAALSSPCNHPFPSSPSSRSMASPSSILPSSLLPSLVIVDLDYTLWKGNVSDQVITALHGVTRLAIASRAPDSMAAVKMLKLMELHAFFRLPLSQSSPPRGQGADEKTETQEERGIGPQEPQELIAIANDGWGKTKHLRDILRWTGAQPHDVLFFDDQKGNLEDARRLGCCAQSVSCADGLSWASLEKGLRLYREKGRARSIMAKHFVKK